MHKTIIVIVMMMVVSLSLSMAGLANGTTTDNTEVKTAAIISDGDGIQTDNTTSELICVKDTLTREADVRNNSVMLLVKHLSDADNINTTIKTDSTPIAVDRIDRKVNSLNQVDNSVELRFDPAEAFKSEVFINSLGTRCSDNFSSPVACIEEKSGTEIIPSIKIKRNNRRDESGNVAIAAINEVEITDKTMMMDANSNNYINSTDQIITSGTTSNGRTTSNGPGDTAIVANTNTDRLLG